MAPRFSRGRKRIPATKPASTSARPRPWPNKPFIYLSAGVSNAQFTESLAIASEAGTDYSGVLCGRATWKDGIPVYARHGLRALEDWLQRDGVRNITAVNAGHTIRPPLVRQAGDFAGLTLSLAQQLRAPGRSSPAAQEQYQHQRAHQFHAHVRGS